MADAAQVLNKSMANWKKWADAKFEALVRQSIQEMCRTVVVATPVDTGFLRGSWQPSIGDPAAAKGSLDESGSKALADVAVIVTSLKPGDRFQMWNNAAYARRLEYGFVGEDSLGRHYDQKGRFYVTDSVKRWPQIVAKMAADLGIQK
ncbi:hypothetical protein UFOVP1040_80 [uncultured Caudovirales phage]|uniref:Uncharacterized protein n=1 Tax=uncultured Caudovirales phage TaxID=2100421 RepID=A0A6J5QE19_9CAUD|nr:hypothetical protein UFOVP1040_80 [uncultured Caudovirales phage]